MVLWTKPYTVFTFKASITIPICNYIFSFIQFSVTASSVSMLTKQASQYGHAYTSRFHSVLTFFFFQKKLGTDSNRSLPKTIQNLELKTANVNESYVQKNPGKPYGDRKLFEQQTWNNIYFSETLHGIPERGSVFGWHATINHPYSTHTMKQLGSFIQVVLSCICRILVPLKMMAV